MDYSFLKCFHDIDLCRIDAIGITQSKPNYPGDTTYIWDDWNFFHSNFDCQLTPSNAQCILNCGQWKACDQSSYFCKAQECQCIGGHCHDLKQQLQVTTPPLTSEGLIKKNKFI